MFIPRQISDSIRRAAKRMPVIAITGPRQSGKTTLAKQIFGNYYYSNLENPETRDYARSNPREFLLQHPQGHVIDEAQYLPDLFSYVMLHVDETGRNGEIILTGSQNFLLSEKISQSLAGRAVIFNLLPFTMSEIKDAAFYPDSVWELVFNGQFPRIYDQHVPPDIFYPSYVQTYIERDVRQLQNIGDLLTFEKFLRLCAGRIGQLFNQSNLANEVGVSVPTISRWMSVLQTGFVAFLLSPYFRNFNKRILKTPKLYFYDTGLASSLLRIKTPSNLQNHHMRGPLFENFIVTEYLKDQVNRGLQADLYYWKDNTGNEIDLLIPQGNEQIAIEIKSASRITDDFFKNLRFFRKLTGNTGKKDYLVYAGEDDQDRGDIQVLSWQRLGIAIAK